jgi:hypothetical protein
MRMSIGERMAIPTSIALLSITLLVAFGCALASACGPKWFPDCGKPGVDCPPCTGNERYPDPCASRTRDAGAITEAGK